MIHLVTLFSHAGWCSEGVHLHVDGQQRRNFEGCRKNLCRWDVPLLVDISRSDGCRSIFSLCFGSSGMRLVETTSSSTKVSNLSPRSDFSPIYLIVGFYRVNCRFSPQDGL